MAQHKTKHILISQIKNIGDVVLALPAAGLIKSHSPDTSISFLSTCYTEPVLKACPYVDHVFDWDSLQSLPDKAIVSLLKDAEISTIIHLSNHTRIARLAKKAQIPCRIGTAQRLSHWIYCNHLINQARRHSGLHEVQLNYQMLKPLNITVDSSIDTLKNYIQLQPSAPLPESLKTLIKPDLFNLILHPGSHGHGREWPAASFKALIDALPASEFRIFLTGSPKENERFGHLAAASPKVVNLMGRMTLEEFMTFIYQTDGLVASGTGPLHLSAALGKKTLGLFPPRQGISPRRWAPVGQQTWSLVYKRPFYEACFLCRDSQHCACMAKIEIKAVLDILRQWQYDK